MYSVLVPHNHVVRTSNVNVFFEPMAGRVYAPHNNSKTSHRHTELHTTASVMINFDHLCCLRLAQRFFFRHNVLNETSYLHYLLKSQERSQDIVNRLRSSQTYEHHSVRTEKFKRSFIPFSVNNYQ